MKKLMAAVAMLGATLGNDAIPPVDARRRRARARQRYGPPEHQVACPRCGAEPGEPCDRFTLGRHLYHLARVEAAKETP